MEDEISECIDLITKEIENQQNKKDNFDVTGLTKQGKIQGLEIARAILTRYWEDEE
ncbi:MULTISPECIES: hypothetical protein [Clostridium]|uniref:Uncharacterized protein n=1 Tax=Clostridium lapidicellarium TaxID=3240931 RepID=A0ABV4DXJ5_9CLOT